MTDLPKTPNEWADWWRAKGFNMIPIGYRTKTPVAGCNWTEWQNQPIPDSVHEDWKARGLFSHGMAMLAGKLWRGPNAGKYAILIDADNLQAIDDICDNHSLKELAGKTLVEQHKDNTNKAHIVLVSPFPFKKKGSDVEKLKKEGKDSDAIALFEVKGEGSHGYHVTAPTIHKDGFPIEILGTTEPYVLTEEAANLWQQRLFDIAQKYTLTYSSGETVESLTKQLNLWQKDIQVVAGNNRHGALMALGESAYFRFKNLLDEDIQRQFFNDLNRMLCAPPLDDNEVKKQWESVKVGILKFSKQTGQQPRYEDLFKLSTTDPRQIILGLKRLSEQSRYVNTESKLTPDKVKELAAIQYERVGGKDFDSAWKNTKTYDSRYLQDLSTHDDFVRQALEKHIGVKISERPAWIIAHQTDKQVKVAYENKTQIETDNGEKVDKYFVDWADILLDAVPTKIAETYNPLTNTVKYAIEFENSRGEKVNIESLPIQELCKEILKTSIAWRPRTINETIAALINAYKDAGLVQTKTEIEEEGFFFIGDKLTASKVPVRFISEEEALRTVSLIKEMQAQFYSKPVDIKRFAHILKLIVQAPFDYAKRQKNYSQELGVIPRPDLAGRPDTGKTNGWARLFLTAYRKQLVDPYYVGQGSVNTEARFMLKTGKTSLPVIFDEVDFLTSYKDDGINRLLGLVKNQASMTHPRDISTKEGREDKKPSYSYPILTHNSDLIPEDGAAKRFSGFSFTESDIKPKADQARFNEYIQNNAEIFALIGDFAISYIMSHPEKLRKDWMTLGREILADLHDLAKVQYPTWLDEYVENNSIEETGDNRRLRIRAILIDEINRCWNMNKMELVVRGEHGEIIGDYPLKERVRLLTEKNLIPSLAVHHDTGICLLSAVVQLIKDKGLERISLQQLADLTGFKTDSVRLGKTMRVVVCTLDQFADFLDLRDTSQATLTNQNNILGNTRNENTETSTSIS